MHKDRTAIGIPMAMPSLLLEVVDSENVLTLTGSVGVEETKAISIAAMDLETGEVAEKEADLVPEAADMYFDVDVDVVVKAMAV